MILTLPFAAFAQQAVTSASVSGSVLDASGAPVSNASVTVRNVDRNQSQTAATDARGRFRFPLLAIGDYELSATADGFARTQQSLRLAIGSALDIPIRLEVTQAASIEVTATAPMIETERTQVATTVSPEEVHDLPLNGRNYLDLALLAPGVSRTNTGANQRFAETSAVPGSGISVSTQRNLANSFVVDGLSANDDAAELAGTFFSQEVIREFAVIRSGGTAEYGHATAGVINVATQSGTNEMRGDVYGFLRNQRFDANNPLSHTKLPLDQKQYGVSASGPLLRDRAFFFANAEQLRQTSGGLITISAANVAAINQRLEAVGFAGPRISTGAFDTTLDTTNFFARVDHAVAAADQLTLRLNTYDVASDNARSTGGLNAVSRGTSLENRDRTLAASNLWTIGSSTISETRAQATRSRLGAPANDQTGPAVTISGIANFGTSTSSPTARDIDLGEIVQNVLWLRGNHALKAGADVLQNRVRIGFPGALQGVYTFSSLANFLSGNYSSYQQAFGAPQTQQTNLNIGAFVQDEWHASSRVTVNAGLRYDVQRLPSLVNTDTNNISPRLGASWDIHGDGRSVLRGAVGAYYAPIPLRAVSNALQRDGVHYRVVQVTRNFAGAPTFPNTFTTFPANVLTNITSIDPDIESSRSDQATIQYERQFGATTTAAIGYEHLRGHGIILSRNVNVPTTTDPSVPNLGRPDPRFANNSQYQSIGDSWYDGLTLTLAKRPVSWGSFRLSYTYSKGLDTSGNFFFSQPQNANDVAAERGRSDNDQRHRLAVSGTLNTPSARSDSLFHRLANGWLFSYIFTYTSALPFNIQLPTDRNGDTNFNDRPAGVGRNTGEGFDYQSLDLRLSRTFALTPDVSIEAIVDAFNVLNRANYQVPNNIITSPTFGQATAVNDPRQLQFGLRVIF
ncbi:MAG: TonB-dependent receptor [Acidobacteria bacterium]|nr:TonB-dependent receptor [Acidobacteriota bacterium]